MPRCHSLDAQSREVNGGSVCIVRMVRGRQIVTGPAQIPFRSCTVVEQRQRRFSPVLDASVKHPELVAAHDDVGRPKHLSRVVRATLHVARLNEDGPISNVCPVSQIATRHELDQVEACARRNVKQSRRLSPALWRAPSVFQVPGEAGFGWSGPTA